MSSGLSPPLRIALLVTAALVAGVVLFFSRRQNVQGHMGGAISRPKQLWLAWAVYVWFCVCPILAFEASLAPPLRTLLGGFAILMWMRGLAEIVMLYGTKSWRPPYGIAHDCLCFAFLLAGLTLQADQLGALRGGLDRWVFALVLVVTVSICLEIYYAWAFFQAVQGKTTGEEGVWFADEADPRYRRINLITSLANGPLYLFLGAFLVVMVGR